MARESFIFTSKELFTGIGIAKTILIEVGLAKAKPKTFA
jgi:hypothetical protein